MMSLPSGMYHHGYSAIHSLDAAVKLVCFALLTVGTVVTDSAPALTAATIVTAAIIYLTQLSAASALEPLRRIWGFLVLIVAVNALFSSDDNVLVSFWAFSLSVTSVAKGVSIALRAALVVLLGNVLVMTTTPLTLADGVERLISPLARLGVPTGDIALTLSIAIGLIPALYAEADSVRRAQNARRARFDTRNFFDKAHSILPLIIPVFVGAFRRASALADSMEARGYACGMAEKARAESRLDSGDIAALVVSAAMCALELIIL